MYPDRISEIIKLAESMDQAYIDSITLHSATYQELVILLIGLSNLPKYNITITKAE